MPGKATTVAQYIAGVMLVLATLKGPGAAQEAQQCIEHTIEYQFNEEDPRLIFTCTIRCNGRLFVTVVYADNPNIVVDFTEHNIVSQDVATSPSTLEVPLQQNNTGLLVCCCGDDIQPLSTNLEEKVTRCDNRTINQFEGDGSVLSNRSNVALVESTFLNVTCWRAPGYYFGGCLVVVFVEDATVLETVYTNAFENETVQKMITVVTVQNINGVALHGVDIFKKPSKEANFAYSFQTNESTEATICTTVNTTSSECTAECNKDATIGLGISTGVLMLIVIGIICGNVYYYYHYHCKKAQSETVSTGRQPGSDDTADLQSRKARNNTSKELQDGLAPHNTSSKHRDLVNIEKPPATTATTPDKATPAKNEGDIKRLSEKDNRPSTGIDNTKKKSSLKRKGSTRSLGGSRRVSPAPSGLHMHKMQDAGARNKDDGMECGQDKLSQTTLADIEIHESDVEV